MELIAEPNQRRPPRSRDTQERTRVLTREEVEKLIKKGAVKIVNPESNQFISQIFVVPKKNGSVRPVVNLRLLNKFIQKRHFKLEGVGMLKDLLQAGDWMVSIDLKDAYQLV